jgi:hypothetical protein
MKVHFDEKSDALYFRLDDSKIIESEEVQPGIMTLMNIIKLLVLKFWEKTGRLKPRLHRRNPPARVEFLQCRGEWHSPHQSNNKIYN